MRSFQRLPEPEVLSQNSVNWGLEWEQRCAQNAGASFHWHVVDGTKVNHTILPRLKEQTQAHCSFCDGFPISPPGIDTIEHFKPKSRFPRDAYSWANLYFCCPFCQQKGNAFDADALRPDEAEFEFDRYFRWDFATGFLGVNPAASDEDRRRAQATVSMYRLNEEHPTLRKQWAFRWRKWKETESLESFPYRAFLESK